MGAQYTLGICYKEGNIAGDTVKKDLKIAFSWFSLAEKNRFETSIFVHFLERKHVIETFASLYELYQNPLLHKWSGFYKSTKEKQIEEKGQEDINIGYTVQFPAEYEDNYKTILEYVLRLIRKPVLRR